MRKMRVIEPVRTINARSGKISWNWTRVEDAHISYLLDRGEVSLNALTTTKAASVVEYIATRESIRKAASVCRTLSDEEIEIITSYAELNADEASYLRVLTFMLKEGLYDDCVLYLPMTRNLRAGINDDNTTVYDRSNFGNHGTIHGAVWQTLLSGKSVLSFDGVDDYVEVPNSESLRIDDRITISVWVKPIPAETYLGVMTQVCGGKGYMNRILIGSESGVILTQFEIGGSSDNFFSINSVNFEQWNHIVYVYDGSNEKYYINGVFDSSQEASGQISTGSNNLLIGKGYTAGYYFKGIIDEVHIYNIALSAAQIKRLFELTRVFYGV